MKVDKFRISNLIKELIVNVDKYLINIPHKEMELKSGIKNSMYNLLRIVYLANETKNMKKRFELQEEAVAEIKCIDFFLNLCYDKELINKKKYLKFGESLEQILTYVYAWKKATIVND